LPALRKLLDPVYRQTLGAQARAFVEAHCDWEKLTDDFESLLLQMTI